MNQTLRAFLAIIVPPALLAMAAYLAEPHAGLAWWQILAGALVAAAYGAWHRFQDPPTAPPSPTASAATLAAVLTMGACAIGCGLPARYVGEVAACNAAYDGCFDAALALSGSREEKAAAFVGCRSQVDAMASRTELSVPGENVLAHTAHLYQPGTRRPYGVLEWPAMLRRLEAKQKTSGYPPYWN